MMKLALSIAVLQSVLAGEMFAGLAPPGSLWQPFYSEKLRVEWKAATNSLPPTVTVLKVVPASFSPAVISNVMRLTSFTSSDRVQSLGSAENAPAGGLFFRSQDERSWLSIVPYGGFITLYAPDRYEPPFDFQCVPDEAKAYELGTNILRRMELPPGEVQVRGDRQPRGVFGAGTFTHHGVSQRNMMRVSFGRQLDKIACDMEELRIEFGAQERVTQLELRWPKVRAEKRYPIATANQMMAWIKEGRACVLDAAVTGARWVDPTGIKRLTIKGIGLHYSALTFWSDGEQKTADRLYPYAVLDAEAELGPGDFETFPLFCAITTEGLLPVSHESRGFSVYPSKEYEKLRQSPGGPAAR